MAKVRVVVVGTGGIARRHGFALNENPDAEIVGAVDVVPEKRESFAAQWGGEACEKLSECLGEADAVYILTPPGFRREYAVEAMAAGKHVFCEKPLAITVEDGQAIVEVAEKKGVVAMTGFNQRYRLGYTRLHDVTAAGTLGRPYHFWCHRYGMGAGATGMIRQGQNWRTDRATLCGMTVESLSHDIDMMRWIMSDEVTSVDGITFSTAKNLQGFDNNSHVLMRLKSGASAMINASWSSRIGFNNRGVLGEKGTAFVSGTDIGNNGIWCSREFHVKTDDDEYEKVEMLQDDLDDASYQEETNDFIDAIVTGKKPLVSAVDGYETLRVSHAILESARRGSIVEIK
jgi:myo-inositol 2-dehydrogenase/D-chiro-inositol 1-dehydrogenase